MTATLPMPCVKTYTRPRENTNTGGVGVDLIAAILRQRPSRPDVGYELVFEAKESGSMVARRKAARRKAGAEEKEVD